VDDEKISDEQKARHIEQLRIFLLGDPEHSTVEWIYVRLIEIGEATWDDDRKILTAKKAGEEYRIQFLSGGMAKILD
jgi:hypothetical protein